MRQTRPPSRPIECRYDLRALRPIAPSRSALVLAVAVPVAAAANRPRDPPDEAAVRALIGRWIDAQNKGDFAAYSALYTPSFHGVRRSLGRTVVLDYEGWLRDRGRMFKKPMKVTATDVQFAHVAPASGLVRATFVQAFSSGSYADRGRKQIDVAVIGGTLVIAREELLESERLPATRGAGGAAGATDDSAAARRPATRLPARPQKRCRSPARFTASQVGWSR